MQATLDQFGRVLIPKKIRQQLGLAAGDALNINIDETSGELILQPQTQNTPKLSLSDCGFPVLSFTAPKVVDFDVVELIKTNREERSNRIIGNLDTSYLTTTYPAQLNEPAPKYGSTTKK